MGHAVRHFSFHFVRHFLISFGRVHLLAVFVAHAILHNSDDVVDYGAVFAV